MFSNLTKKALKSLALISLLPLFLASCEKESERLPDYLMEFVTVEMEGSDYRFRADNGKLLIPDRVTNLSAKTGQRVIINYVPLEGNNIHINYASPIFTGKIEADGYPENYADTPVKIQSVWVGGDYLNLIIETEYHSVPHSVALLRDSSSESLDIYFSHSSNNDSPGYPKVLYASFLIKEIREQANVSPVPFHFFVNTYEGMRTFNLELR